MIRTMRARMQVFSRYSTLLHELVFRDIKIKYRGSILGVVWTVLNPLLNMIVMTIVFGTIFAYGPDYPVYYLSGYLIFTLNVEASTEAMYSVMRSGGLMKKVYVPKYIFPLSKVIVAVVNSLFSVAVLLIIMPVAGVPYRLTLLLLPLGIAYITIFATGLGLLLAALAVRFRDLTYLYSVVTYAWTFLTPIFYDISMFQNAPLLLSAMNFNPMWHYVNFSRNVVLNGTWPSPTLHLFCLGFGLLMFAIGCYVFYKMQDTFIFYI